MPKTSNEDYEPKPLSQNVMGHAPVGKENQPDKRQNFEFELKSFIKFI